MLEIIGSIKKTFEEMLGHEEDRGKYHTFIDTDLEFVEKLQFDINGRFLMAIGKDQVLIFNLELQECQHFYINQANYTSILDAVLLSESNKKYDCYLACILRS